MFPVHVNYVRLSVSKKTPFTQTTTVKTNQRLQQKVLKQLTNDTSLVYMLNISQLKEDNRWDLFVFGSVKRKEK